MGKMDERDVFTRSYEGVEPETLWTAVKRALATMDLREADDEHRTAQFSTGVSLTSWGQNMFAAVTGGATGAAMLTVRGRPKGSFLTSKPGEDLHARKVEQQVLSSVEAHLKSNGET